MNTSHGANINNTDINALQPFQGSVYNGLQTQLTRMSARHASTGIVYTYSKAMDVSDNSRASGLTFAYPTYWGRNWARAGYDRNHHFQWRSVYNFLFGKDQAYLTHGVLGYIAGGWRVCTILSRVSGTPFNVTASSGPLNAPGNTQLAEQNSGTNVVLNTNANGARQYLNPAASSDVTPTAVTTPRFGTSGRNSVRGPSEGKFDFEILDHWVAVARQQHVHLVKLWFGAWKNAFSNYDPAWVKQDTRRFPRAMTVDGRELEILSPLGTETLRSDAKSYAALLTHLRDTDAEQQTVLMVPVENEVGYLGRGRDRSPQTNTLFLATVPQALMDYLEAHRAPLSPELVTHFKLQGKTWPEVFDEAADEVFMAWDYARYIQSVTEAGKRIYPLPMYVNAQLPAQTERAGEYPSGAPHPYYLAVYRPAAPAIDFYSPDIYWPDFEYWIQRYKSPENPIFGPETLMEAASVNALYAFG